MYNFVYNCVYVCVCVCVYIDMANTKLIKDDLDG